jgi:hypothetical protein
MNCFEDCATTQLAVFAVVRMHGPDHRDIRTIDFWAWRCQGSQRIDQSSTITGYRTCW